MNQKTNITEIIRKAQKIMLSFPDPVHDIAHVVRVYDWAMRLSEYYPKADKNVLTIAAFWHDVGRKKQSLERDDHPEKSAQMVARYLKRGGFSSRFINKIKEAILSHSEKCNPETIEGRIIHDADKLAWLSPHALPDTLRSCRDGFTTNIIDEKAVLARIKPVLSKDRKDSGFDKLFVLPESKEFYSQLRSEFLTALQRIGLLKKK